MGHQRDSRSLDPLRAPPDTCLHGGRHATGTGFRTGGVTIDSPSPPASRSWRTLALPLLLAAAAGAVTIDAGFVLDDSGAILESPVVQGEVGPADALARNFWGHSFGAPEKVSWRPVMPLVWRGLWLLGDGSPLPFHAFSLLLHVLATWAFGVLMLRLLPDRWTAVAAAVLFAVHGTHSEVVGGIVSQADLASTLLGASALVLLLPRDGRALRPGLALVLLGLGMVAKESAIVFWPAGMAAMLAARAPRRAQWAWAAGGLAILAADGWVQVLSHGAGARSPLDNVLVLMDPAARWWAALGILWRELALSFLPVHVAPFHGYAAITSAWQESLLPGGLAVAALGAGLWRGAGAVRAGRTGEAVWLVLLFAPAILGSNLLFIGPTEYADRLLYPATAAGCVALALVCRAGMHAWRRSVAVAVVAAALAATTWFYQRPWHDSESLFRHAVASEPRSWRAHLNLGRFAPDAMESLWHVLLAEHLKMRQPAPVDWEPVETLEGLPRRNASSPRPPPWNPSRRAS